MRSLFLVAPLVFATAGLAATKVKTFAPKNDLHLQDHLFWNNSEIDEARFNAVIDHVENLYKPIVEAHGAKLEVVRKWNDGTVNAYAEQSGSTWKVTMFGGLARRPEVSPDGFALVVCHELGHHLAGFAFYGPTDWASNEGQSDYFATLSCARKIWGEQIEENATWRDKSHPTVISKCNAQWETEAEQNLCYRAAMGGKSLAELLAALGGQTVDIDRPDTNEVSRTANAHPAGQCRMDTYFAGALCTANFDESVIPGKNHADGQTSQAAELLASKYSCMAASGHTVGHRPRCWFKPTLTLALDKANVKVEEVSGNGDDIWEPGETFGVNVALVNNLAATVDDATLAISSDSAEVTVGNSAAYPEVATGETKFADTGVAVTLGDSMTCGKRFDLEAEVSSGTGNVKETLNFIVGKAAELASVESDEKVTLPDNDVTKISNEFTAEGNVLRAVVDLDITHSYPRDLVVKLISPAGNAYTIVNRQNGTGGIKGTFVIDVDNETAKGDWVLEVADTAYMDSGVLNSRKIRLETAVCNRGVSML